MKKMLCLISLLGICCGCSSNQPEAETSELLQDPTCDLMYFMTEACYETGVRERSEDLCADLAAEVKNSFTEGWESLGDAAHEDARVICMEECERGIAGEEMPSVSEVCRPAAATTSQRLTL